MANVQDVNSLWFFDNAVDDAIHMGLAPVQQMADVRIFRGPRATVRMLLEAGDRIGESQIPFPSGCRFFSVDLFVQERQIAFGARRSPNVICHA
jgi:hypothetical protein